MKVKILKITRLTVLIAGLTGPTSWATEIKREKIEQYIQETRVSLVEEINKLKDKLELRAGVSFTNRKVKADFDTEDDVQAPGFQTAIALRASPRFEINVSSYVHLGKVNQLDFEFDGMRLQGDGSQTSAAFAPLLKFIPGNVVMKNWYPYYFAGPSWSLQSLKLKPFIDRQGVSRIDHKLTYESVGGVIGIGLEEHLPFKEMHPVFLELLFSYMHAYEVKLVDASDFIEVKTISDEERSSKINGTIFMVNMGMTFF
jgi:hypothetical protein